MHINETVNYDPESRGLVDSVAVESLSIRE